MPVWTRDFQPEDFPIYEGRERAIIETWKFNGVGVSGFDEQGSAGLFERVSDKKRFVAYCYTLWNRARHWTEECYRRAINDQFWVASGLNHKHHFKVIDSLTVLRVPARSWSMTYLWDR